MKKIYQIIAMAAFASFALTACEDDTAIINPDPGRPSTAPDITATSKATISSASTPGTDIVFLNIGDPEDENLAPDDLGCVDQITLKLNAPAEKDIDLRIGIEESYLTDYTYASKYLIGFKKTHNLELIAPSSQNSIKFNDAAEAIVTIKAGETESEPVQLLFLREFLDYTFSSTLFPIRATDSSTGELYAEIFFVITPTSNLSDQTGEKPFVFIGHVDTEVMNPLIATQFRLSITKTKRRKPTIDVYEGKLYDIINLRTATIRQNSTGNAELYLNADISHVLKNAAKYVRPLQQAGIKTCLAVKGGGTGLGFSNMTDAKISEFVNQLKVTVEMYGLDGVNLFDDGAAYELDGAAAVNPESYAKLIKAVKTAMPDKLLTMVDTREITEALCDPVAGISVGQYLDYAWSKVMEFTAPYEPGFNIRPLSGVPEEKYATLNMFDLSQWDEEFMFEFEENSMFTDLIMEERTEPFSATKVLVTDNIPYYDYNIEVFIWDLLYFNLIVMPLDEDGYSSLWEVKKTNVVWKYYAFKKDW